MRLWVASSDFPADISISQQILQQANDTLQKVHSVMGRECVTACLGGCLELVIDGATLSVCLSACILLSLAPQHVSLHAGQPW